MGRKLERVRVQVLAVEALRALRSFMSGKEVLDILAGAGIELSVVDLSRYVTGSVLPSPQRSEAILGALSEANVLGTVLRRALVMDERGVVNVARIAYDSAILSLAAALAFRELRGVGVTKVLTAAVNGIPLATRIAHALDADLCVAKHEPDASVESYVETRYFAPDPPRYVHLYLPAFAINARDRIAVVDDLLHTGRTLRALTRLAEQRGAAVSAVFALIAMGQEWRGAVPEGARVVVALPLD